jgi:hypothetical protein
MPILIFIKDLLIATASQLISLFAGILTFGLLINYFSRLTFKSVEKAFGNRGVYLLAWLGTPIHELGHALFCVVFLHKIIDIKFFKPDPVTGTLGYVYHSWNKKNPWQVLGNFFIGIGPVILGCATLAAAYYILIPGSQSVWNSIIVKTSGIDGSSIISYWEAWRGSGLDILKTIFVLDNMTGWRFWVFLYLGLCISSNIRLSLADVKHLPMGFGCIVLPLLVLNMICLIIGTDNNSIILPFFAASLAVVNSVLMLALVLILLGFSIIYIISGAYYRLKYKTTLNPF